jgi:alkylation response protein AidB-like acyl-CoA dehydrogenase
LSVHASSDLTEAIALIRNSAEGIAVRRDLSRVRRLRFTHPGFDRAIWNQMCALGWPAMLLPEDLGGAGLGLVAYCALMQELGAALVPEPLVQAMLCSAYLRGEALARHLSGEMLVLPAWQIARDTLEPEEGVHLRDGKLYGRKTHVQGAAGADAILAITPRDAWLVSGSDPALRIETAQTQDGCHVGLVVFDGAACEGYAADPSPAFAEASLATAAYLLGLIEESLERTVDYLRMRTQFGKPIGSFQALQHRAVDLKLQVELTRASIDEAAHRWDREPGKLASYAAISRAKARASNAAMLVTQHAIQLHGGIGFTDEHDIGLFLRKAMVIAPQFGSAALHAARFAQYQPVTER